MNNYVKKEKAFCLSTYLSCNIRAWSQFQQTSGKGGSCLEIL